ncbi:hypothetical protein [Campylobacter geochelonis]|nr:hypothetical protein [Campylobacter geochelonis]CZE50013.1 Uncharacterised protein [Campylobacter geochelonis]
MHEFSIVSYQDGYKQEILEVWESLVLATHDFLLLDDFKEIKGVV